MLLDGSCIKSAVFSLGVLDDDVIHLHLGNDKLIFPFNRRDTVGEFIDMLEAETKVDCKIVNEGE
jgi:antitoxin component of MazEF toxin-antitoxin module